MRNIQKNCTFLSAERSVPLHLELKVMLIC